MKFYLFILTFFFNSFVYANCQEKFFILAGGNTYNKNTMLLVEAVKNGNKGRVKELLSNKDIVNLNSIKDINGLSLLNLAIKHDQIQIVELLLDNNIDIRQQDSFGLSPIFFAVAENNARIFNKLVEYDLNLLNSLHPSNRNTLLHKAARHNSVDVARLLILYNANPSAKNSTRDTPIGIAHAFKYSEVIKVIKETKREKSRISTINGHKLSFYEYQIKLAIQEKRINHQDKDGNTLFHKLAGIKHLTFRESFILGKLISQLILDQADIHIKNNLGLTPVHLIIQNNQFLVIPTLIEHLKEFNIQDNEGNTFLHLLTEKMSDSTISNFKMKYVLTIIKSLLQQKAGINIQNAQGNTPLHILANTDKSQNKHILNLVDILIMQAKANTSIKNTHGQTAADIASKKGSLKLLKKLNPSSK